MLASETGHSTAVSLLLDSGADHKATDKDGDTALHVACGNGNMANIWSLLEVGADPNAIDNDGYTPLHAAAVMGEVEALQALLAAGANPNNRSGKGRTPLMLAAAKEHAEAVSVLLNASSKAPLTPGPSSKPQPPPPPPRRMSCFTPESPLVMSPLRRRANSIAPDNLKGFERKMRSCSQLVQMDVITDCSITLSLSTTDEAFGLRIASHLPAALLSLVNQQSQASTRRPSESLTDFVKDLSTQRDSQIVSYEESKRNEQEKPDNEDRMSVPLDYSANQSPTELGHQEEQIEYRIPKKNEPIDLRLEPCEGRTPLMLAAAKEYAEAVSVLLTAPSKAPSNALGPLGTLGPSKFYKPKRRMSCFTPESHSVMHPVRPRANSIAPGKGMDRTRSCGQLAQMDVIVVSEQSVVLS